MDYRKINKWVCGISTLFILAGCSGGSGGGDGATNSATTPTTGNSITQGVAVDPYIVGAVFQEVAADGVTILQRQSTPSDANGVFTFPSPLTPGSTVEMKVSSKGLHGGAPFQGLLRRNVKADDNLTVTVSPLTTMVANGILPNDAIMVLNNAGFSGFTTADLYANPMNGLTDLSSGITDQKLKLLQAAMAVEGYMEITGNFQPTLGDITNTSQTQILDSMAAAMRSTLSAAEFTRVSTALAGDPQMTGPLTLGDMIMAVTQQQQTLISQVRSDMAANGDFNPALVDQSVQNIQAQTETMTKTQFMARMDMPSQADGATLYAANCGNCHGALASTDKPNRTATQIETAVTNNLGGMSTLANLTSGEIQAIADAMATTTPPPPAPTDGPTLYTNNCAGCHNALANTNKPGRTAADIQNAITNNIGNMGYLSTLTSAEIQAIANALPAAPPPDPGTPPDGTALYNSECAGCHGSLASTTKPGRTAAQIQAAITNNVGNMGYLSTLTSAEVQAIASVLPAAPPPPVTPPSGATLYTNNCAGCHGALASTTKPGRTAAQIQAAITNNVGNMGYLSTLTSAEVQAIASVLPAAPPPPATPPNGATLYTNNCAGCHGALASTNKPGRTAAQIQAAITNNVGNMGYLSTLTSAEIQAIASVLPAAPPEGPDYSNCTACHGQPPSGTSYPNVAGRHAVHTTLPSINNNCAVCHAGAAHNGTVNLGVAATFKAETGTASVNSNMTCAGISCHGGQTTPVWQTGSIAVDTQCTSCHASGTTQYNSYSSGQHSRHISKGYACTVCHNNTKLATGHFTNLATSTFEQDPAATIGGGSTSVGSYTPSTSNATSGTCSSIACHGSKSW